MLNQKIFFKNFKLKDNKKNKKKINQNLKNLINSSNQVISSLSKNYEDSYDKKFLVKLNNTKNITLIGMGGSILGSKAIYNFLKPKKKKISFC